MRTALEEEKLRGVSLGVGWSLLIALCAVAATLIYLHHRWWTSLFFDAHSYGDGIMRMREGLSPYVPSDPDLFLYPPIFAYVGAWLAGLVTPAIGWVLYLALHITAVLALPFILARGYLRPMKNAEALALYLAAPIPLTMLVLVGGNIASIYYCLALLAALPGIYRGRWRYFYPIVILASATKVTFLVLLLLPLLAGSGQMLASAVTVAFTGAIYGLQWAFLRGLYEQFRRMVAGRVFQSRDYGGAVFGFVANALERHHIRSFAIAWAAQIVVAAAVVLILMRFRDRTTLLDRRWLALVVLAIVLVNPRDMYYEVIVGIVPAYFLLLSNLRLRTTWVLLAITAAGFCVHHGAAGQLLLLISAFIVGVRSLTMATPGKLVEV